MDSFKTNRSGKNGSDLILWNFPESINLHKNVNRNKLIAKRNSLLLRLAECANEIKRIDEQLK